MGSGALYAYIVCAAGSLPGGQPVGTGAQAAQREDFGGGVSRPGRSCGAVLSCLVVLWVLSHSTADEALGLGILLLLAAAAYCTWRLVQRRDGRSSLPADNAAGPSTATDA